jgi:hypothetical protein
VGIFLALGFLALVWLGSKRPKFRTLAILVFTLECLLFREDGLNVGDVGFWVIVAMVVIALWSLYQDKNAKTKSQ